MDDEFMDYEGFEWLAEKDENIDYITEVLIEENGKDIPEVGIAVMVNAPCEIVFTISDLRKIIEILKEDE